MIDIKLIRENPELVKENIRKKFQDEKIVLVDKVVKLDEDWRKLKFEEDALRSERNKISKKIAELKKAGKKADKEMKEAKEIPEKISKSEEKRKKLEEKIREIMLIIPNIIHESVPVGKSDKENVVEYIPELEEYTFLASKAGFTDVHVQTIKKSWVESYVEKL